MALTAEEFSHVLALFKPKSKNRKRSRNIDNCSPEDTTSCSDQAGRLIDLSTSYNTLTRSQDAGKRFMHTNPVCCKFCGKQFPAERMLRQHFLHMHSEQSGLKCSHCFFIARSQLDLESHQCKVKQVLSCEICDEKFRSKRDLFIHQKAHEIKHECPHCDKEFADIGRLNKHVRDAHIDEGFLCSKCHKKFDCKETFLYHVKFAHSEERPQLCVCGKRFKTLKYLKVHYNLMHQKKAAKDTCAYQQQVNLAKTALRETTGESESEASKSQSFVPNFHSKFRATCPVCHKIVYSAATLYAHKVLHTNPKICPKCDAQFAWNWHLRKHEKSCSGSPSARMLNKKLKPYQCFLCNTRFSNGAKLTEHMRDHAKLDFSTRSTSKSAQFRSSPEDHSTSESEVVSRGIDTANVQKNTNIEKERENVNSSDHYREFCSVAVLPDFDIRSRMETPIDFDERLCPHVVTNNRPIQGTVPMCSEPTAPTEPPVTLNAQTSVPNTQSHCAASVQNFLEQICFPNYEFASGSKSKVLNKTTVCDNNGVPVSCSENRGPGFFSSFQEGGDGELHSVEGILNEVFDMGGPMSPPLFSDSLLNTPYTNSLLLDDSFVLPHDML